jgi:hypothetical protein
MAEVPPLIPDAERWMDNNLNVMLIGLHGVGKTEEVLALAKKKGLKLKYYSCSTMDPFTDFVGVPFARQGENGEEYLKMVRPREVDDAEIIFFDEFNRADPKVHNALFELIQFRKINGETLPNLRMVWAAMNPPGQDYDVEELDPALIDRFDVFEDVKAAPSVPYMTSVGIDADVARALVQWHKGMNQNRRGADIITPRRLVKLGLLHTQGLDFKSGIPNWVQNVDRQKLRKMLQNIEARQAASGANDGPRSDFTYTPEWLKDNDVLVAEHLRDNPTDEETQIAVKHVLEPRQAGKLVRDYGRILDAMIPSLLEAFLTDMSEAKFQQVKVEVKSINEIDKPSMENFILAVESEADGR